MLLLSAPMWINTMSIITLLVDEETERQQDRVDMQMGIMRPEEYRAKWYGESVDEALKNLPQSAEVIE